MSSLLRPVGHLPASVYWFRRGLVLAVVLLLVFLLSRLFGSGADAKNTAASNSGPNPSSSAPIATGTPTTTPTATVTTKKSTETPTKSAPPADRKCDGSDLQVVALPGNRKIVSGSVLNFVVQLSPTGDGCKATVDADRLTVSITSGTDLIWTTTHCTKAIQTATIVVAKGKQAAVTVPWNGHRSGPGCLPGQPVAKPGTYVVKANYAGRLSGPQAFQIV
ncbi:hypothetical protein AB0E69_02055 [Kribbella sp. NPDC026611]|uniref:hypothetical protein n=1 Tax=Kribbella sp. NPDC026611 TaxID=3154911 RepID=UPI0033DED7A0